MAIPVLKFAEKMKVITLLLTAVLLLAFLATPVSTDNTAVPNEKDDTYVDIRRTGYDKVTYW